MPRKAKPIKDAVRERIARKVRAARQDYIEAQVSCDWPLVGRLAAIKRNRGNDLLVYDTDHNPAALARLNAARERMDRAQVRYAEVEDAYSIQCEVFQREYERYMNGEGL